MAATSGFGGVAGDSSVRLPVGDWGLEMIWSETPPTKSGWYWVKARNTGSQFVRFRTDDGYWPFAGNVTPADDRMARYYLFGPPIPSPEQCHEIAKGQS